MNEKPDIERRSLIFAIRVVQFCKTLEKSSLIAQPLLKQLVRSGTSIGANVTEAQAGQSRADFISKNQIALKEARETIYWLTIIRETNILEHNELPSLIAEVLTIGRILGAIIVKAKQNAGLLE